jgi:hypothetical protein
MRMNLARAYLYRYDLATRTPSPLAEMVAADEYNPVLHCW